MATLSDLPADIEMATFSDPPADIKMDTFSDPVADIEMDTFSDPPADIKMAAIHMDVASCFHGPLDKYAPCIRDRFDMAAIFDRLIVYGGGSLENILWVKETDLLRRIPHIDQAQVSLGVLSGMPPELIYEVLSHLDIKSVDTFRLANRAAYHTVNSWRPFKLITKYAPTVLHSIRITGLGYGRRLSHLFHALQRRDCSFCYVKLAAARPNAPPRTEADPRGGTGRHLYLRSFDRFCDECWYALYPHIANDDGFMLPTPRRRTLDRRIKYRDPFAFRRWAPIVDRHKMFTVLLRRGSKGCVGTRAVYDNLADNLFPRVVAPWFDLEGGNKRVRWLLGKSRAEYSSVNTADFSASDLD